MYSITMINKNGYTIKRKFKTIAACKDFANFINKTILTGQRINSLSPNLTFLVE